MVMLTGEMQAWALLALTNTTIIDCTKDPVRTNTRLA